jgi:hypothetical protein
VVGPGTGAAPFTLGPPTVAPTNVKAVPDSAGHVVVSWAPVPNSYPDNGGFAIKQYAIECQAPGEAAQAFTTGPSLTSISLPVSAFTTNVPTTCKVAAQNLPPVVGPGTGAAPFTLA